VFCTRGEKALVIADPRHDKTTLFTVPAYPVAGPTDTVGAGDSSSAAIACALAAGIGLPQAGAFGNLAASITIQQIGVTGTATPTQLRDRWRQIQRAKEGAATVSVGLQ
jgi:sugar/nucleoside kinase (ribokinase family)